MKIIERIVNTETNETIDIEREMTAQELAEKEAAENFFSEQAQAQAEAEAKKAAAEAKLAALGLTPEDLKALGLS